MSTKPSPSSTVSATEFARNFSRYRDIATERGIVHVTSHGRVIGGYLSASQLEIYEENKRRSRQVLIVGELDEETIAAIEAAEYGVGPK